MAVSDTQYWGLVPTLVWIATRNMNLVNDAIVQNWTMRRADTRLSIGRVFDKAGGPEPSDGSANWKFKNCSDARTELDRAIKAGRVDIRRTRAGEDSFARARVLYLWPPNEAAIDEPTATANVGSRVVAGTNREPAAASATSSLSTRRRRHGPPSLAEVDAPLLAEMHIAITEKRALTPEEAARLFADKARDRGGTFESKTRRLARRYRERHGS